MSMLDSDLQIGRDLYEVNVFGVIAVTQAFFPLLRKAKGTVASIGSCLLEGGPALYWGYYAERVRSIRRPRRDCCPRRSKIESF